MNILQMALFSFLSSTLKSKTTQEVQFLDHFLLKSLLEYSEYILISFLSPKENETKLKTLLLTRIKYLPLLQVKQGFTTTAAAAVESKQSHPRYCGGWLGSAPLLHQGRSMSSSTSAARLNGKGDFAFD